MNPKLAVTDVTRTETEHDVTAALDRAEDPEKPTGELTLTQPTPDEEGCFALCFSIPGLGAWTVRLQVEEDSGSEDASPWPEQA